MDGFKVAGELPGQDPNARKPSDSRWARVRELLRQHAGQWCQVAEYEKATTAAAVALSQRKRSGAGFEFASRTEAVNGTKVGRVYGRYTPPTEQPTPPEGA